MITFISGGARSGKSTFAENYALKHKNARPLIYIATAERTDREMEERISRHQDERDVSWQTIEAPIDITSSLHKLQQHQIVLVDCLTVWVTNMMYRQNASLSTLQNEVEKWIGISNQKQLNLVLVSNDVNEGVPDANSFVHQFIYHLEQVHHLLTTKADYVYQVVGGIPIKWKGGLG